MSNSSSVDLSKMRLSLQNVVGTVILADCGMAQTEIGGLSGSHTDIPRWCGKPYEAGSPNFLPGGNLEPPKPSATPMLFLKAETRHSVYDSSESHGDFIVDAELSYIHGQPLPAGYRYGSDELDVEIRIAGDERSLLNGNVLVNTTRNLLHFEFGSLKPRLAPYPLVISATLQHGKENLTYEANTKLYYLSAKSTGSTVKIDRLHGGLLVANNVTDYVFRAFLPFGFYASCSGYLNYSLANVSAYKDLGFNAINPVCAFTDGDLGFLFDWMDSLDLWYQYDMRGSYRNLASVADQIPLVKDRSNLLTWYTADEPDGWQYALGSTKLAYDLLTREDPYHPTALVLNCDNYFFEDYTAGTDLVMQDAYPVGIDPVFSRKFNTTCNETYGDCGCDNCLGYLKDVSDRLDTYSQYQEWLGDQRKPLWSVLQAFSGEFYWSRDPTPDETNVMVLLSLNHRAKGVMSWLFPTSDVLHATHGALANAVTSPPINHIILDGEPTKIDVLDIPSLDAAYWIADGKVMISIANADNEAIKRSISIQLPVGVSKLSSEPWKQPPNSSAWMLSNDRTLVTPFFGRLATSILILDTHTMYAE